jgi:hypothetical protein
VRNQSACLGRHDLLRTQLAIGAGRHDDHARTVRQAQLHPLISDIQRRQKNLITRLEQQDETGDPQTDQEYRQGIQRRFAELAAEHRARTEELAQIKAATPGHTNNDPDLLTRVPQLPLALAALPEALQRGLYDAFKLQVRYYRPRHEVTIRVTIRADALPGLARLVKEAAGQPSTSARSGSPDVIRSHVLSAPGRHPERGNARRSVDRCRSKPARSCPGRRAAWAVRDAVTAVGRSALVPKFSTCVVRLTRTTQKGACGSGHQCQRGSLAPVPPHPAG